ncbi:hypothetical protein [Embleya sp. NPDC050493]|uniref:hypothetical protein n=1 Tax=Embleya sp. NPDC050493 TaxID=3363989 RepID=UPI0037913375
MGLEIPKALIAMSAARAARAIERPVSGREGIGALPAQRLLRLASDTTAHPPSMVVADLATAMFAHTLRADDQSLSRTSRRILPARIYAYVHDPHLDPDRAEHRRCRPVHGGCSGRTAHGRCRFPVWIEYRISNAEYCLH